MLKKCTMKDDRINVVTSDCEGFITTERKTKCLGTIFGIAFTAHLYTNKGEVKIEYLVRMKKREPTWAWGEGKGSVHFSEPSAN